MLEIKEVWAVVRVYRSDLPFDREIKGFCTTKEQAWVWIRSQPQPDASWYTVERAKLLEN